MDYRDVICDFIDRTQKNLAVIEGVAKAKDDEAYEVTQLINSLLGLVVLPREKALINDSDTVESLEADGWVFPSTNANFKRPKRLGQIVRLMRNCIAHWSITFLSEGNKIAGIHFVHKNKIGRKKKRREVIDWEGSMKVDELRSFVQNLAGLAKRRAAAS